MTERDAMAAGGIDTELVPGGTPRAPGRWAAS